MCKRNFVKSALVVALLFFLACTPVFAVTGKSIHDYKGLASALNKGGVYYLSKDITLGKSGLSKKLIDLGYYQAGSSTTTTIDLNGHSIDCGNFVIYVGELTGTAISAMTAKLTITNSSSEEGIISGSNTATGVFNVRSNSTLILNSGVSVQLEGNGSSESSAVVSYGNVVLNDATVSSSSRAITAKCDTGILTGVKPKSTLRVGGASVVAGDIVAVESSEVEITGGTVYGDLLALGKEAIINIFGGRVLGQVMSGHASSQVYISGGEFDGQLVKQSGKFVVTGGSFIFDPSEVLDSESSIRDTGRFTVVSTNAAKVDGKEYKELDTAVSAASDNAVLTVLNPVSLENGDIRISGKNLTIDLFGNGLKSESGTVFAVEEGASLTITDSIGGGFIETVSGIALDAAKASSLMIEGGDFKGPIVYPENGSAAVTGGRFSQRPSFVSSDSVVFGTPDSEYPFEVKDRSLASAKSGDLYFTSVGQAVERADESAVVILDSRAWDKTLQIPAGKDVTVDLAGFPAKSAITVSGKLTIADSTDGAALLDGSLKVAGNGSITISGGSFTYDPSAYLEAGKFAKYDREGGFYTVTMPSNSASLSLTGNIGVNLYVDAFSYTDDADAYIKIVHNDLITIKGVDAPGEEIIKLSDLTSDGKGRNKIISNVGPVQLLNTVSVFLYDGEDNLLYSRENFGGMDFCRLIVENGANFDPKLVDLCNALLNYGSYTQLYFNAMTDELPNEGLGIEDLVTGVDTSDWGMDYGTFSGDLPAYVGTALVCNSDMVVRHYFKDPVDGYLISFSQKPEGSAIGMRSGYNSTGYYIEVYGIESSNLDEYYSISMVDTQSGARYGITYSPMCYVRKTVSRSSKQTLVNLCKAIYCYNEAAKAYFN